MAQGELAPKNRRSPFAVQVERSHITQLASFDDGRGLAATTCKIDNLMESEESWLNQTLLK